MASIWQRFIPQRETRSVTPSIPPRSTSVATPNTALTLTAVWRSCQILGTTVSNLGIHTKRYASGMEARIDNPIFVNNPSLRGSRRELLYALVVDLALDGNAFLFKSKSATGIINNVIQLPANLVAVSLADSSRIDSPKIYSYAGNDYAEDQIEHLQLFPRAGYLRSQSPVTTCAQDIIGALDVRDFASNWFSSSGIPTGVLKRNGEVNAEQANEMRTRWHEMQRTRQLAVIGNGFEYQPITLKPSEALFTEVSAQSVQQIARLFGIPARKLLTGVDGTSDTYSNLTDEEMAFYRETLMAYTRPIQDALSNCLPRGTRIDFDWEDLFKANKADRITMWSDAIAAGIITPEYAAQKEGLI